MSIPHDNPNTQEIHCLAHTMLKDGSITQEEMTHYDKLCLIGVGCHEHAMENIELSYEQISLLWAKISPQAMRSIVANLP